MPSSASCVLFVCGNDGVMRRTYKLGRGYWSAAFPVILEKWGFLSLDQSDQSILTDRDRLQQYDLIIIGNLAAADITEECFEKLTSLGIPVFFEGPLPYPLAGRIEILSEARPFDATTAIRVQDSRLALRLAAHCPRSFDGEKNLIPVEPRHFVTADKDFDFISSRVAASSENNFRNAARDIMISVLFTLRNRYRSTGRFFPARDANLVASLAARTALEKLGAGRHANNLRHALEAAIRQQTDESQSGENSGQPLKNLDQRLLGGSSEKFALPEEEVAAVLVDNEIPPGASVQENLRKLSGKSLVVVFGVLAELARRGRDQDASELFLYLKSHLYDLQNGAFRQADIVEGTLSVRELFVNHPLAWLALAKISGPIELSHTPSIVTADYPGDHLRRWEATPLERQAIRAADAAIIARFDNEEPALIRTGNFYASTFPILSHLVHHYTCEPLERTYFEMSSLNYVTLERLLFELLDQAMADSNARMLKLAPWPGGYRYCLTIRHDVDRIPTPQAFDRLLEAHAEKGTKPTWFWLPWRIDAQQLQQQEALGHEIGLHSVQLLRKPWEIEQIKQHLKRQPDVWGEAVHGTASDYWLGAATVRLARDAGLKYCEFVPESRPHPCAGFPILLADGRVETFRGLIGLEASTTVDPVAAGAKTRDMIKSSGLVFEWANQGGHICILNHPDMSFDALRALIDALPAGRLNWTLAQVAEWWSATHSLDHVSITQAGATSGEKTYRLVFEHPADNVGVRLRHAEGRPPIATIDGETAQVWPTHEFGWSEVRISARSGIPIEVNVRFEVANNALS